MLNIYFNSIVCLSGRYRSYSQILKFFRFSIFFLITFFHYFRKYTGSAITFLYISGICILLLILVIDMVFSTILAISVIFLLIFLFFSSCFSARLSITYIFLSHVLGRSILIRGFFLY